MAQISIQADGPHITERVQREESGPGCLAGVGDMYREFSTTEFGLTSAICIQYSKPAMDDQLKSSGL